jgi:hypothetical protein
MSTAATNNRISHIVELLGPAVLLAWPSGSKGSRKKWKHLQLTNMSDQAYLARLEKSGNIGVALGRVSNGLVTIDLDCEDCVNPLLDANPLLRNTLRTAAERGCNIWVRCGSEYPRSCSLTDPSARKIGDWRADGNQPARVSSTATDNERHGNYLCDNTSHPLDKFLAEGKQAVPLRLAIVSPTVVLISRIKPMIVALCRSRL